VDKAIPCGLIINELLSNSLKYAFPEGKKGELIISMRRIAGLKSEMKNQKPEIELIISDNGIELPEDPDVENSKTLGLELVNGLTQQLEGKIELDRR